MLEFDRLFATIEELVMLHFPSGAVSEINQRLMGKLAAQGVNAIVDRADNTIALILGRKPQKSIVLTAHKKYEIGALENVGLMQALLYNHSECFLSLTQIKLTEVCAGDDTHKLGPAQPLAFSPS
ncbi:hypothetical protein [Microcoleus sp. OTE_8_concoct_300]|uniref:hypothetical protein n=1 Tax=Microcoleus sp. OTE_8_concoct_300 TaxID=2964710 RepID=UPI00403F5696